MVHGRTNPEDGRTDWSHAWARDAIKLEQLKTRSMVGRAQGLVSTNTDLVLPRQAPEHIPYFQLLHVIFKVLCIYVQGID